MNKPKGKSRRWRKAGKRDTGPEAFLREREPFCVAACARFLHRSAFHDQVWVLRDGEDKVEALLLHSKRSFFPVFNGLKDIAAPHFLNRRIRNTPFHAVQGLREDALVLENIIETFGFRPAESIDYDLMALDREPAAGCFKAGPPGLVIRQPDGRDMAKLLPLQAAYEQEEVLPRGAVFDPSSNRAALEHILSRERILCAELNGRMIAKANTSAASFTRSQIGGVYVHPDYRGRGIATRLCAELVLSLRAPDTAAPSPAGRGISLFVKKQNPAARAVYRRIGFEVLSDYRISYY
jgi:ribosomal protein S18 acetylase RimI-like enzyme